MEKKIFSIIVLFFTTLLACANTVNLNPRYQYTFFSVINNTHYPVALTIVDVKGIFETPVAINVPMILNPKEKYQNTLISVPQGNDIQSYVSSAVAEIGNERENYLIFSENGSSHDQSVFADIFDGLGKIFVGSFTNNCAADTAAGFADCELTVQE